MSLAWSNGEHRHERCKYGVFSAESVRIDAATGDAEPFAMPLCSWSPPAPHPPLLARVWSGAIEFDRDCAECSCFDPVRAS